MKPQIDSCAVLMIISVAALLLLAFHTPECEAAEPKRVEQVEKYCEGVVDEYLPELLKDLSWVPISEHSIEIKDSLAGMIRYQCRADIYYYLEGGIPNETAKIF